MILILIEIFFLKNCKKLKKEIYKKKKKKKKKKKNIIQYYLVISLDNHNILYFKKYKEYKNIITFIKVLKNFKVLNNMNKKIINNLILIIFYN